MYRAHADVEFIHNVLPGFPSLASFIATDPDRTTFIYNRFDELSARNLLYLQSELAELQSKQRKFDEEDATSRNMENKQCARNFASFEKAALQDGNEKQKERMNLMLQIRRTIKEYQETLILASTLAALPSLSKTTLRAFRTEFLNEWPDKTQSFPTLGGSSANLYENAAELVALKVQPNEDRLSKLVHEHLGFMFPASHRYYRHMKCNLIVTDKPKGPFTFARRHCIWFGESNRHICRVVQHTVSRTTIDRGDSFIVLRPVTQD
jgi:hypothetical protein